MAFENITFAAANGVARLTLNRPDKLNSFTEAMHAEVRQALDQIQEDSAI
ncbi:MAG: 2-(1,2-epoxy-1,2-dihydrophenyl)acetyl-CoA isomerase, partial [Burkholderiaceae bacterium]|nr:2-(1,2-epoxy-1,2-dihydrophenyl)acetyl-CoA isomerase [Burkholderiaceae bacterium]